MKTVQKKNLFYGSLLLCCAGCLASCIDEDMSDCPPFSKEIVITYQLEMAQDVDLGFGTEMESLHLGFWNTPSSLYSERIIPESDLPEDLIFRVTLPVDNYSHIAMANCVQHDGSHISLGQNLENAAFRRIFVQPDTVMAAEHPGYSGNLVMDMGMNYGDETYRVLLSPVSSKYEIHVNHPATLTGMKCFVQGTKESYLGWGQEWTGSGNTVTDASAFAARETSGESTEFTFYTFPTTGEKVVRSGEMQPGWWKLYFYSELGDKTVQHIFTVKEPVAAGKVFKGTFNVTEQGGEAVDVNAGVEFDPDWKPGNDFDIEM